MACKQLLAQCSSSLVFRTCLPRIRLDTQGAEVGQYWCVYIRFVIQSGRHYTPSLRPPWLSHFFMTPFLALWVSPSEVKGGSMCSVPWGQCWHWSVRQGAKADEHLSQHDREAAAWNIRLRSWLVYISRKALCLGLREIESYRGSFEVLFLDSSWNSWYDAWCLIPIMRLIKIITLKKLHLDG